MSTFAKVVLITGGSSGLGRAMCSRLTAMGHRVYGTSRKVNGVEKVEGLTLIGMDLGDEAGIQKAIAEVIRREGRIDVLINNAGIGIQGPIEDISTEMAMQLFDTNVIGTHRVCRAVLPHMRSAMSGLIINISSVAANFGLPYRGFYSASKAAIDRYGEALAIELAPFNISVVTVQPGEFKTTIGDKRLRPATVGEAYRPGYDRAMQVLEGSLGTSRDPDELARAIARIISDPAPKAVYHVAEGKQKLSILIKKLVPGRMFQRLIGKHYE